MATLTLKTAVSIANQVYADRGYEFPWSFVAVPGQKPAELKLRLIQVEEDVERSGSAYYEHGPHGFYAECSRVLSRLMNELRDEIVTKGCERVAI